MDLHATPMWCINIHILNCDRVLVLFYTFCRKKNPKLCCWIDFQLLMTEQSDVYEITAKSSVKSPPDLRFAIRPIHIAWRATMCEKCAFFACYQPGRNGYWSYPKSYNGRWFSASKSNFFVTSFWCGINMHIHFLWRKFENIWWGVVWYAKEPQRTAAVQTVVNTNYKVRNTV